MAQFSPYIAQLRGLDAANRKRALVMPKGLDFASNDYLGLSRSPVLAQFAQEALDQNIPLGSGGSRLLGGNHRAHQALEEYAAAHYGAQAALFFATGYAANMALFSTVPQTGDLVFYDALIHASTHDGMALGRAETQSFAHNDADALDAAITVRRKEGHTGQIWIAAESLYSMDGDFAPLTDLLTIANRHDAMLVVDEAHATGVFGPQGRGLSAQLHAPDNMLALHTCGKAMGLEGGLITMPAVLREFFINRARPFIFSTAPSPMTAYIVRRAIGHIAETPALIKKLHGHIALAHKLFDLPKRNKSQIIPIILGEDQLAVAAAQNLQKAGFDVRAIRPPTVPQGTARLRLSLTLNVTAQDIENLAKTIADVKGSMAA